jgi:pimeloyl-ACP methyl ester carboxylesterase
MEYFSELGFDCTAFDAPGHGLSEDGPVDLVRIARIVAELSKKQGDFDAAVGHSLGGMALHLALSQGLKLQKLATVASPFSIPRVVAEFCSKIGAGQRLEQVLIQRLKQRYSERSDLFETEPWCARHKVPGLVVHDRDDADVSFEDALAYSEHWLGGQLLETRGLGHRKPLRDSAVIQALGKAFEEVTAPTFQIDRDSEL